MLSLFVNQLPGSQRVAVTRDGRLIRYQQLNSEQENVQLGTIFLARITKVAAGISAAFVEIGQQQAGFLNGIDTRLAVVDGGKITTVSKPKEGQAVLVQLTKQAIREKLATYSCDLKLVGFNSILQPLEKGIRYSHDYRGDKQCWQERLASAVMGEQQPGWIVRTGADEAAPEEVHAEAGQLWQDWQTVCQGIHSGKPRPLHRPQPLMQLLTEGNKEGWRSILVDSPQLQQQLKSELTVRNRVLLRALKLHELETPLFDTYRIEDEVAKLQATRVWLKSGGTLDIQQSEAMLTIDVNTTKNQTTRKQTAALNTNMEAVEEIAHQVMVRNLAGLLVIDFVNARETGWRKNVDAALKKAFAKDYARNEIMAVNKLGVAMIARQRGLRDYQHSHNETCPRCHGRGYVKRTRTLAIEIQRKLLREIHGMEGEQLVIQAGQELANYLRAHHDLLFASLEQEHGVTIQIEKARIADRAYQLGM